MGPQEALSLASALITIFSKIGSAPVVFLALLLLLGPWAFSLLFAWGMNKRFSAMQIMYENNVKLVECYEGLAKGQADMIALNTAEWSRALSLIETSQFCPMVRVQIEKKLPEVPR